METCQLLLVAGENLRMQGDRLGGRSRLRELGGEPARVKLVVQNPVSALHVPVDRRSVPRPTTRRGNPLRIEIVSYVARFASIDVVTKNANARCPLPIMRFPGSPGTGS